MLDNLKLRWLVIVCTIVSSLYYIYPSVDYYIFNNLSQQKQSLNLGLDLRGGLNIILELDDYLFLQRLSKKNLSNQSRNKFNEILKSAQKNANNNNTKLIKEVELYSESNNIKLNKYFSNLSKSSDNYQVIKEINSQHDYAMQSILDIMRNRIEDHDQYGLGEPSIQKLGDNRLVVELAGVTDISKELQQMEF